MTAAAQLVGKAVANQIDVGSIIAFDRWAMCNTPEQYLTKLVHYPEALRAATLLSVSIARNYRRERRR
jgi:hypothetical protein